MTETLLAYLAPGFRAGEENLATEALAFILERTEAARDGLCGLISRWGIEVPEVRFSTQDVVEESRLDVVGKSSNGERHLIVEAKFWAGLTERQPVDYLRKLDPPGSLLLFLAPEKRIEGLWHELQRRCRELSIELREENTVGQAARLAHAQGPGIDGTIAAMGWGTVLDHIESALVASGDASTRADLAQLRGLCARQAEEGFLPVSEAEISSPAIPRRLAQYADLVDSLVDWSVGQDFISTKGLKATASRYGHGRYVEFVNPETGGALTGGERFPAYIHVNLGLWQRAATPLWLRFWDGGVVRPMLEELGWEVPPRLVLDGDHAYVPLFLPIGRERDAVLQDLGHQLVKVHGLLMQGASMARPAPASDVGELAPEDVGPLPEEGGDLADGPATDPPAAQQDMGPRGPDPSQAAPP